MMPEAVGNPHDPPPGNYGWKVAVESRQHAGVERGVVGVGTLRRKEHSGADYHARCDAQTHAPGGIAMVVVTCRPRPTCLAAPT